MLNFNNPLTIDTTTINKKLSEIEINRVSSAVISNVNNLTIAASRLTQVPLDTTAVLKKQEFLSSAAENSKKVLAGDPIDSVKTPGSELNFASNILHDYSTYTYSLSLHVIPIKKYNDIVLGKKQYHTADNTVLIASAGRNNSEFSRNANFIEDFYFDDLKMTTVVGLNHRTRNTNAIDINFTIIEPYGFTFLNRLLKVAAEIEAESWFQIPFMLQIEFLGNTDTGEQVNSIPGTTKRIPIKIIGCKSKVSSRGAEYQIQAIPFNHSAMSESVATTPAVLKVQAKTIQEFFSSTESPGEASNITKFKNVSKERQEQITKEIENERKKGSNSTRVAELETQKKNLQQDIANTGFVVHSYASAINSYQMQLKENNHLLHPDQYRFVFDEEIAKSKIVFPKKTELRTTPMVSVNSPGGIAAIRAQAGLPAAGPDANSEIFTINAGTSVIEVINQVIRSSEYIRNQFSNSKQTSTTNEPIKWYKITPVVEIKEFDELLNRYSRVITYHISKYSYYNNKFRDAPQSIPSSYSKLYSYMYTGQNNDIIDFSIDFDTMFYTMVTASPYKSQKTRIQKTEEEKETSESVPTKNQTKVQLPVTQPVSGQANVPDPASVDELSVLINDFSEASMSGSRGDMINVQLKIVGDPQLIKQDDIMYNPFNGVSQTPGLVDPNSNSIVFDAGEVFALLEFKTPTDFNEATGLMDFEKAEISVFSGLYKILTVDNEFRSGMFTQTLNLIRLFNQETFDTVVSEPVQSDERAKDIQTPSEQQQAAAQARAEFAKTDERRTDLKNIQDAVKARAEFAANDPRRIIQEQQSIKSKFDEVAGGASRFIDNSTKSLKNWWKSL